MKISDLNEALGEYAIPEGLSEARKAVWQSWIDMAKSGAVTKEEFEQFKESCKYPRQVYSIENMPEDMIEELKNSFVDPKYDHLNTLLDENSEEHKNDRMVQKHIDFFGMPICVEIISGGVKYSTTYEGKPWQRTLKCDYGYFDGITGADGEYLDVYVGDHFQDPESKVYIVRQMRPDGSEFDEDKVVIGCMDKDQAEQLYLKHCHSNKCFGGISEYTIDQFREYLSTKK